MSIKFNHKILLIALMGLTLVSCQKEMSEENGETIDTGNPNPPGNTTSNKLAKGYYWYDGDTTGIPTYADTIYYNTANQLEKVIRTWESNDVETYEFQYNGFKKVSKIINRIAGDGWDYIFYYSSAGRLDSLASYEVSGSTSTLRRITALEYTADNLKKLYSYGSNGVARNINDSVEYYRINSKLDSFKIYHVAGVSGPPDVSRSEWTGVSTVNTSSFSDIISSGYILTHSYDYELSVYFDRLIHQFVNPNELILRNVNQRQIWNGSADVEEPIRYHYTFDPSNKLVRTLVIEYVIQGTSEYEAFKFEYVK